MKRVLLLCLLLSLVSCGNFSGSLPKVKDVCSVMNDVAFMRYCYTKFDVNKDGKVSMEEAASVYNMDCSLISDEVVSLKGIEYFANLTSINCTGCEKLKTVDLSLNQKITDIPKDAFLGCGSLESIILPKTLISIGDRAFQLCNLESILIPEQVEVIGDEAFSYNSSKIDSVVIPDKVKRIGRGVFYGSEINYFKGRGVSSDGCCLLDDGMLIAFRGNRNMTTYRFPEDVHFIEYKSFDYSVSGLKELIIPATVECISDLAFENASSLISVKFEGLTPPKFFSSWGLGTEKLYFPTAYMTRDFKMYVPEASVAEYKNHPALQTYAKFIVGYK